jgi:GH43 family beta-xylosidase
VNRVAAPRLRRSLAIALVLCGCGGGGSSTHGGGTAATLANGAESAGIAVPVPTSTPTPPIVGPPLPAEATFTNPLLPSGPDPHVARANGVYYYTQTSGDRIRLWSTPAMSRLAQARPVTIFVAPRSGPNSRDLWAPELHRLDGKWYVYYAAGDGTSTPTDPFASQRMFVLENDRADPAEGTWTDRGRLAIPGEDAWAIDGTVLEYAGRRYFLWSGRASPDDRDQHLYVATMTNPWTLAPGAVRLSSPDRAWERTGRAGVNEGPQVLRSPSGGVFLVYSANGCWADDYSLGMLALRTGGDPLNTADWVRSERPVFAKNAAGGVYAPGHNAFFKSPDGTQDWLVYHANSSPGQGCGDARTPRMQPITWRADGTPDFGTPVPVDRRLAVPSGELAGP